MKAWLIERLNELRGRMTLPPHDLLRQATYRRLWISILTSSFGGQVTMLALPLTAAVLLHATPTQMGLLTAMEIVPFVLFSLPSGVWLDRVRKLPVYVIGETSLAVVVASVPFAWWMGWLSMPWLYVAGFVIGAIYTTAGSAAQIVLTQVVTRDRLVEAHAKNALATSGAEVAGPGLAASSSCSQSRRSMHSQPPSLPSSRVSRQSTRSSSSSMAYCRCLSSDTGRAAVPPNTSRMGARWSWLPGMTR